MLTAEKGFNLVESRGGGKARREGGEIPAVAAVDVVVAQLLFTPSLSRDDKRNK